MQRGEVKNKCDSKLSGCIESKLRNIAGNVFDLFAKSFAFWNGTYEMVQRTTCTCYQNIYYCRFREI